jgi:hypothetical protein
MAASISIIEALTGQIDGQVVSRNGFLCNTTCGHATATQGRRLPVRTPM